MGDQQTRERSTALVFYGCVLLLAYLMYLVFQPFLRPLIWAGIFATFFYPQFRRLERRFGKTNAATICTIMVGLIIVVPFVLIVTAFVQQATQTLGSIDAVTSSAELEKLQRAWVWAHNQWFGRGLGSFDETKKQVITWVTGEVANAAGDILMNIVTMVVSLTVSLFAMFFFFRDGDAIMDRVRRVLPFEATFSERQISKTGDLIRASISAGFIVAIVQGTLGGIAFAALGLGAPIFWGVMMAFFALLPLGAGVVWVPVAGWLVMTGHVGRGVALVIIGAGVIGLVDNFLRPVILSGRTQMNGLLVFIGLLGGIAAFGILGLVLGPIIVAMTVSFVNAYATERRKPEEAAANPQ